MENEKVVRSKRSFTPSLNRSPKRIQHGRLEKTSNHIEISSSDVDIFRSDSELFESGGIQWL
jgi:hypothetical protein